MLWVIFLARRTSKKTIKTKKAKAANKAVKKASPHKKTVKKAPKASRKKPLKRPAEPALDLEKLRAQELVAKVGRILGDSGVRQNLIEVGGENALAIVRNFYGNHSDEEIAKKLKIKISDVRATLNRLHNEGLVNYIREKDSETGWYSYSWSLNHERMERWASIQNSRLASIDAEGGEHYFCPACGSSSITDFESAATIEFRCERCNKLLEFIDDKKMNDLFLRSK